VEDLIILSDIHLGSDLNDRLPSDDVPRRSRAVDEDLVRLLEHYRRTPPKGARWRLIIAGDFIDFIGMTVAPGDPAADGLLTELSAEEQAHGLGNTEDHARAKLRRVLARHADVFDALAAFVADGHALTMVHGNHDLELHWDGVRDELCAALAKRVPCEADRAAFKARIDFAPWFYYVGGVAYVEHGHQYDADCSTENLMAPFSPEDPRRTARNFSDTLLRYVVRHTRGLREHGHENKGAFDYLSFGVRLGARGVVALGVRFTRAVLALFRLRRQSLSENAKTLRAEHERRLRLLAEATRIGIDRMKALAALQIPPVTTSIRGILASVLLDRLALGLASALALVAVGVFLSGAGHRGGAVACVLAAWILAQKYLESQRNLDPHEEMIGRAAKLARLFPAAFVVMGHTHLPVRVPVSDDATYINVGSWSEEQPEENDAHAYRAARTHLVIRVGEGQPVAEFLTWDSAMVSPRPWQS